MALNYSNKSRRLVLNLDSGMFSIKWLISNQCILRIVILTLFLLGGNKSIAQVFNLGNSGYTLGWYKLGTLNLPQGGSHAEFRIIAANGYNAAQSQLGECTIHFETSNGVSQINGFYGAGHFFNTGRSKIVSHIKIIQNSLDTWDFYAFLPGFTGEGATINLNSINGTWSSNFVFINPPTNSISIDLTEELLYSSKVYFNENVGIGTSSPTEKLSVNGKIRAHEIKVETQNWPDYVFADDYKLSSLQEVAVYIKKNKHLPEVPSADSMIVKGIELGEMNKLLLKKIEELTLHLIKQNERLTDQEQRAKNQEATITQLSSKLESIKNIIPSNE